MNTSPLTVRAEAFGGTGTELLELLRREVNKLIQRDAAMNENGALSAAGAAQATTATQAKTVNTVVYTIGGAFKSKAATDNLWTLSGAVVAVSSFQKYLLCLGPTGTASIIECVQAASAAAVTLPSYQTFNGVAVIATLTVATDATHPFTPGTTALNATGITSTFIDGFDTALIAGSLIKTFDPTGPG
jgi:hypothetical protein